VHPDDLAGWRRPAPGETLTGILRIRHANDTWRWFEITTTNLLHDPAVRRYVSNYRDVTARKLAEDASRESQKRLEYLLSATSAVTYTARVGDARGTTFISGNVEALLGYTPEDFYADGNFWWNHLHVDDVTDVQRSMAIMAERGEATSEYRLRHRDGTYRRIRDSGRMTKDEHGAPLELVGYFSDITEQHRAALSLQRSEASFRTLIEGSLTSTIIHRGGFTVYVNPAAVAMFGYRTAEEMIGRPALDFVHPDDREAVRRNMQPSLSRGASSGEARMVRRDGSVFVVEAEGMRLEFDGQPATVVMGRDVTERRELFARMAMADRMLTVGTLAAGVAHEINNPLAYVATNLEVLQMSVASPELRTLVDEACEGVSRVSTIVRELRALARPEDDTRGPVDLRAVLASSIKMARHEIRHHARVLEQYEADLPPVYAHASRLGQVFLNMLLNAAQAIPPGRADGNEIRVRARTSPDRQKVYAEIEDTGVGIPSTILRRIFDPFFTTKPTGEGMGLGLAISHQIVRAMDGEIGVDSQPGFGSTFRVTLPAKELRTTGAAVDAIELPVTGARILLIDDEAAVGRSLTALLAPENEVVPVTCAQDALSRLRTGESFDVIVCDLMMPEITGIELYERVDDANRSRMIFMTGGAFTPQARQFLASLGRPHLEKPFSGTDLRRAIQRIVARSG
jgi:PAS domain S-box-containing protein